MNEHAGPACALSVLIVGVFAVLLHDKERNPPAPPTAAPITSAVEGRPAGPTVPLPAPVPLPPTPIRPVPPAPASVPSPPAPPTAVVPSTHAPRREPAPRPIPKSVPATRPKPPKGEFTVVEAGETLADVAGRVYGPSGSSVALWKANRDQLSQVDSPLPAGTLLRTP